MSVTLVHFLTAIMSTLNKQRKQKHTGYLTGLIIITVAIISYDINPIKASSLCYFVRPFSFPRRQQHNDYSQGVQNDDNTRETTLLTQ